MKKAQDYPAKFHFIAEWKDFKSPAQDGKVSSDPERNMPAVFGGPTHVINMQHTLIEELFVQNSRAYTSNLIIVKKDQKHSFCEQAAKLQI